MRTLHTTLLALASAALLAACGGGDSEPAAQPAVADKVPASAAASVAAYTQFAASLRRSETWPPLTMEGIVAPTSETALPLPVL